MFFANRMQKLKERQAKLIEEGSLLRERTIRQDGPVKTAAHVVDRVTATTMQVTQFVYQHPFIVGALGGFLVGFRPAALTRLVRTSWSAFGLTRQLTNPVGMAQFLLTRLTKR